MRAERFFVAVATTVFVLYGMPASARTVRQLCMHARETLSVFAQALRRKWPDQNVHEKQDS